MRTPITYYGGKQTLLPDILPLIPKHDLYTEAFCGGAAVLFAKHPAPAEIINDLNSYLITFYRVMKLRHNDLKARIDATIHARDHHEHANHILSFPAFFDEVDIAWAIWVVSKMSYASKLDGSFGYDMSGTMPKKVENAKRAFTDELCARLEHVTIENRDALDVIRTYDGPDAFHFVDPPYINSDCGHYEGLFGDNDMTRLLELLTTLKGKFMFTMFPYDEIAEFATVHGWHIHKVERTISVAKTNRRRQEEWMVVNYEREDSPRSLFDR